jgi:hypothetical protein
MGSITKERAMQAGVDAVQHTPSIPAEPKPHRAAPDAFDLFEQLGSTVKVRRSAKYIGRAIQQSSAGGSSLAAPGL